VASTSNGRAARRRDLGVFALERQLLFVACMSHAWDDDSTWTWSGEEVPEVIVEDVTLVYEPPSGPRPNAPPCPVCGMNDALGTTDVILGYVCDACASN
jgi:hypothetical protein